MRVKQVVFFFSCTPTPKLEQYNSGILNLNNSQKLSQNYGWHTVVAIFGLSDFIILHIQHQLQELLLEETEPVSEE